MPADKQSLLWDDWTNYLNFLSKIDDSDLRMHVGYLYLIGTPIEKDYWRTQNFRNGNKLSAIKLSDEYEKLVKDVPHVWRFYESDPRSEEFSTPFFLNGTEQDISLNADVVRTQVDISNMFNFGILNQIKSVTEIGGGYGQLAVAMTRALPDVKYTIVDLPSQLAIQKRWLSHIGSDVGYSKENQIRLVSSQEFDFHTKQTVDLLINVNSFCEMQEIEIRKYIDGSRIDFNWLYSNNREIQFMNHGMSKPLSQIFADYFNFSPTLREYMDCGFALTKYVFLGGKFEPPKKLLPNEIFGISPWNNQFEVN